MADTTLTKVPKKETTKGRVKFRFSSTEHHSSFECKLVGEPFAPCTSPLWMRVGLGKHLFKVKAIDPSGNIDPSPAKAKFKRERRL